jgi:hypothetical protein
MASFYGVLRAGDGAVLEVTIRTCKVYVAIYF